jgi:hypothetical protein
MEAHAERWSAHWDEVEDWQDAIPMRPTRRCPADEWTTLDWVDTVILSTDLPIPAGYVPHQKEQCP